MSKDNYETEMVVIHFNNTREYHDKARLWEKGFILMGLDRDAALKKMAERLENCFYKELEAVKSPLIYNLVLSDIDFESAAEQILSEDYGAPIITEDSD